MSIFAGVVTDGQHTFVRSAELAKLTSLITAYGADQPRLWRQEDSAIAHCQSVITCEDAFEQQPWLDQVSGCCFAFDGRLDNRSDLIRQLAVASSLPDSRIVAAAFDRWGDRAPELLLGDFAFACWNTRTRRLLLVCDQTGGRVIYYARQRNRMVFATVVNSVRDLLGNAPSIDEDALTNVLLDRGTGSTRTLYAGIERVPPAGLVCWTPDSFSVRRYWKPEPKRTLHYRRDEDYVEAGRELLDRAVSSCLRSATPVAAALSGGLDSGGVAATAARLMGSQPLSALTAVPDPNAPLPASTAVRGNEWSQASRTAQMHPNMVHHAAPAGDLTHYENDPAIVFRLLGAMPRNGLNSAWLHPFREKARSLGCGAVLTGVAGNLTLSWDGNRALADYARRGQWIRLAREFWACTRSGGSSARGLLWKHVLAPSLPVSWRAAMRQWRRNSDDIWCSSSPIHPEFARKIRLADQLLEGERLDILDVQGGTFELRALSLDYFWTGRANLAGLRPLLGYEARDPLGDLRLVEFCLSLPPEQYLRDGVRRRLARRVLADRLPKEVLYAKQRGRQCPEWFYRLTRRRAVIRESLASFRSSPFASHYIDLPRLERIASDWPVDADAAEPRYAELVLTLLRGYEIGRFLCWMESGQSAAVADARSYALSL